MFKRSIIKKIVLTLFLIIELFLYFSFLYLDIFKDFSSPSSYLKYASIIICFLVSFFAIFIKNPADLKYFIPISLIFTLVSDYFLLLKSGIENSIYGVSFFIVVQFIYFIFIEKNNNSFSSFLVSLLSRIVLTLVLIIVLKFNNFDKLSILSGCYFLELVINFLTSFKLLKYNKKFLIFSLGLLLFMGCDICVGLNNLAILTGEAKNIVAILMWGFYLPSQVLLASTNYINKDRKYFII